VTAAIAGAGGNIVELSQHTDRDVGAFNARIEVDAGVDREALTSSFDALHRTMGLACTIHDVAVRPRVVVLCSSVLHCLSDLLARIDLGELACDVIAVISDRTDAAALAHRAGVPFFHVPVGEDRADQEAAVAALLHDLEPDLVVLARYMRILPEHMVAAFEGRMINVHHSFLPAFIGANPYRRAHERGVKMIGATAHYVTAELDAGPIIEQDVTRVTHADRVPDLIRLGADLERAVLVRAVGLHLEHRVFIVANRTCIFR
jgi:formyltetrahydrofolate deformylase